MPAHIHLANMDSAQINGSITIGDDLWFKTVTGRFSLSNAFGADIASNRAHTYNHTANLNASHNHKIEINNSGESQFHNNLSPYIVALLWRRTA